MNMVLIVMDRFSEVVNNQSDITLCKAQIVNTAKQYNLTMKEMQKIISILIEKDMIELYSGTIMNGIISKYAYIKLTEKALNHYKISV